MKRNILLVIILAVAPFEHHANGANILYLNGIPSPSHHIWNSALVNGLAVNGHNITVLSPDQEKNPPKNAHYILLEGLYNEAYNDLIKALVNSEFDESPLTASIHFQDYMAYMCQELIQTKGFHRLLEYPNDFRFDLIISDMSQGGCLLGFLHKFQNPPLLAVTPFSHPPYLNEYIGGHHYYSYVPHYNLEYHSGEMSFIQRFYNFIVHMIEMIHYEYSFVHKIDKLIQNAFNTKLPSVSELEQRTAIAFVSTNPIYDYTQPLPENVIPVGGLHIRDPKSLPQDLEDFIVSSKNGTVLFSLGSNIQSSLISIEKQTSLLNAFEQFPNYHFLWKFEKPINLKLPKNVMIRPWLPQSDILNHPKTKAFITHSGLLSTLESIWRGVPMIGMPFGFDQNMNLDKSIEKGLAIKVNFQTITTNILTTSIHQILENPKYVESAKKFSKIFRDQKETPLQRAVWWAEWLIRNPNCEHLKSPVLKLGFIAGNSYDIIAIVSIVLFIIFWVLIKKCLFVIRKLCCGSSNRLNGIQQKKKIK